MKAAQIAQKIGKHRSVVTREINQSGGSRQDYSPQKAQQAYLARRSKNASKATQPIYEAIEQGLRQQWSPEQINGRSQQQQQPMLSTAAIYNHIWRDQRQGGTLYKELRHASSPIENVMESPMDVLKRSGKPLNQVSTNGPPSLTRRHALAIGTGPPARLDTVIGPNHKGVLITLTERSTNYLLMKRVDDKSAHNTRLALIACLQESGLPVLTLTSDNGSEFADYQQVAKVLKADFYFAHPYHAWEGGANEHNDKLIRQYIAKKMPGRRCGLFTDGPFGSEKLPRSHQ